MIGYLNALLDRDLKYTAEERNRLVTDAVRKLSDDELYMLMLRKKRDSYNYRIFTKSYHFNLPLDVLEKINRIKKINNKLSINSLIRNLLM